MSWIGSSFNAKKKERSWDEMKSWRFGNIIPPACTSTKWKANLSLQNGYFPTHFKGWWKVPFFKFHYSTESSWIIIHHVGVSKNPIKMDDLGVPLFSETCMSTKDWSETPFGMSFFSAVILNKDAKLAIHVGFSVQYPFTSIYLL